MPAVKPASSSAKKLNDGRGGIKKPIQEIEEAHRIRLDGRMASFFLLLFFSGTAALIYQVLWIRQLSLVVGVDIYSITVAVSAFFAGLALGGVLLGRMADGWKRPLLLYALLEAGVALAGFVVTVALAHTAGSFVAIESHVGVFAWALPFLLVGAPAFLMGGTLPVAVRSLAAGTSRVAKVGGWVYAANTAGGIAGALLTSFLLLPWLGVRNSALAAALLNLVAAGVALALDRQSKAEQITGKDVEALDTPPTGSRTALVLYAIAGGIALGYEVVWSQAMAQFLSTRVFAFSVVLATYLTGLVVGSALYARFSNRVHDAWGVFGLLISAAGVVALLEIACLSLWQLRLQAEAGNLALSVTGSEFARMCAQFLVAAVGVVFVPTILLGAAFPVVLQLAADPKRPGRDVGAVLALNTAGGIAGTLLTGFLLVPALGLVHTFSVLAVAAATVGALAVLLGTGVSRKVQWAVFSIGLVTVAVGILSPPDRLARLLLTTRGGGALIFYQETRGATVAIAQQQSGDNVFRRLYIQGVFQFRGRATISALYAPSGDATPAHSSRRAKVCTRDWIWHGHHCWSCFAISAIEPESLRGVASSSRKSGSTLSRELQGRFRSALADSHQRRTARATAHLRTV